MKAGINSILNQKIMIKFIVNILVVLSLFTFQVQAQTRKITGIVKDSTGPVVAVTIFDKDNSSKKTTSDADGKFTIDVSNTAKILVFQYVGFVTKEIVLGTQNNLTVTLQEDVQSLTDVVIVGYAQQKKITLTGAVSSVSGAEIRQSPSASLQNTLAGRMPGFSSQQRNGKPGSDGAQFYVRGQSSFSGSNNPLIIVDDIEFTYTQFSRLDPNEIQNISILKDASTTAIYGIKGANGVVVVTTTRGKIGPPKISVRSEYGISAPTIWPEYLNAYEAAKFRVIAETNSNNWAPVVGFTPTFSEQDLELYRTGADPYGHPDVDWKKVLFKDFSSQIRSNFDITGGTEKAKYFVSLGYLNQDGIINDFAEKGDLPSNFYHRRINYRSNLDLKVTEMMDLRIDLFGNLGETNNPQLADNIFLDYANWDVSAPFSYPVYNPDGSFGYSLRQRNGNANRNNIVGRLKYNGYNRNNDNNINLISTVNHKLDFITKGLSLKGTLSFANTYSYNRDVTRANGSFPSFIYDPVSGVYTPRDATIFRVLPATLTYNSGNTGRNLTVLGILNYDRTFGDHHVYGLALANRTSRTAASNNVAYNFVPENNLGFTGRIGYDFQNRYLFQFNMGYNGSDRFESSRRFGFFPAVSAGWNISEETFFKDHIKFINQFKIRSSYGLVGSDGTNGVYSYQQLYTLGSGNTSFGINHTAYPGIAEGALPNNEVTWEKERKFDIGVDFALFKSKITGSVDYFYNRRYDILTSRGTVSTIFGQGLPLVNLGETENKGYEIELGFKDNIGQDFSYGLRGTYSVANNKILNRDESPTNETYRLLTGKPIGSTLLYKWIGFYTEAEARANSPVASPAPRPGDLKYADLNGDGTINSSDQFATDFSNFPPITYGLTLNLSYKAFAMSVLFQGSAGNYVRSQGTGIMAFSSQIQPIHYEYWTPEKGDASLWHGAYATAQLSNAATYPSTFFSRKADYSRIRSAEVSYTLPNKLVKKLKMESVRLYTNGFNLFTWSKSADFYNRDPELNNGVDAGVYPPMKYYNFGVNVTF